MVMEKLILTIFVVCYTLKIFVGLKNELLIIFVYFYSFKPEFDILIFLLLSKFLFEIYYISN